jgi:hypothetical protein
MDSVESKLGARIKRLFIAFLISNMVSYIQIWLGMEYNNLAKDFDAICAQDGTHSSNLSRASVLFKKAARLTFTLFGLGITMTIIYGSMYSNMLMSMVRLMSSSSLYGTSMITGMLLPLLIVIFVMFITITIVNLVTNDTVNKAWNLVLSYFVEDCKSKVCMPGATKQVERILKGVKNAKIAYWLLIIVGILMVAFFALLYGFLLGTSIGHFTRAYSYGMLATGIPMLVFAAIGAIFSMLGMINQAIGLFDLAKALQGNASIGMQKPVVSGNTVNQQLPSRGMPPLAREMSLQPTERRFCPSCGEKLQPDWNALFCPKCGEKLP